MTIGKDSPSGQTVLQVRIAERLAELRMSARQASLEAGLGADAIRLVLSGRSRSPRADTLVALSKVLQCDVGYLAGTQDTPFLRTSLHRLADNTLVGVTTLDLEVELKTGFHPISDDDRTAFETDLPTLPQYLPGFQFAGQLVDDSFASIYSPGTILHFLRADWERAEPRDGDIVVLTRQRIGPNDTGEIETSLRRVRQITPGIVMLETAPLPPRAGEAIMWEGPDVAAPTSPGAIRRHVPNGEALQLEGIALRAVQHISGPQIKLRPVDPERDPFAQRKAELRALAQSPHSAVDE
jgi:hypothetical protein